MKAINPSSALREANRCEVLRLLRPGVPLSRGDLGEYTGMTPAGVSRIVRDLLHMGLIKEFSSEISGSIGRRSNVLTIDPDGMQVLGLALTANEQRLGRLNARGEILESVGLQFGDNMKPDLLTEEIAQQAINLTKGRTVAGMGVAVATNHAIGPDGVVSSNFLGWHRVPLRQMLEQAIKTPVTVATRAASLAQAEISSTGLNEPNNFFLINGGVGLGSAWVQGGNAKSEGVEFGSPNHLQQPNTAERCHCGKIGCLERVASGLAVAMRFHQLPDPPPSYLQLGPVLNRIKTLAAKGNPEAQRAYRQAGYRLGNGICQINQLLAPTRVLLAGETGSQPDFVAGVMERLAEESNQPVLTVSHVKSISAAGAVALETHLFSSNTTLTLGEAA